MFEGIYDAPTYSQRYDFPDGAQPNLFQDATVGGTPATVPSSGSNSGSSAAGSSAAAAPPAASSTAQAASSPSPSPANANAAPSASSSPAVAGAAAASPSYVPFSYSSRPQLTPPQLLTRTCARARVVFLLFRCRGLDA